MMHPNCEILSSLDANDASEYTRICRLFRSTLRYSSTIFADCLMRLMNLFRLWICRFKNFYSVTWYAWLIIKQMSGLVWQMHDTLARADRYVVKSALLVICCSLSIYLHWLISNQVSPSCCFVRICTPSNYTLSHSNNLDSKLVRAYSMKRLNVLSLANRQSST